MRKALLLSSACALMTCVATAAHALTFDFTIDNSLGSLPRNSMYSITGVIDGLTDNTANEAATSLILTGYPSEISAPQAPIDLVSAATVTSNMFDVSNGQITNASFSAYGATFSFMLKSTGYSDMTDGVNTVVQYNAALAFPTDTGSTPAPEPATLGILGAGLLGLSVLRRGRAD